MLGGGRALNTDYTDDADFRGFFLGGLQLLDESDLSDFLSY